MRSRSSRFANSGIAAAFGLFVALYASVALGFYWLMQPSVLRNHGVAAYSPPPATVIRDTPWVPPDSAAEAFAYAPPRRLEESSVPAAKPEVKTSESRPAPAPQRRARVRQAPAPAWGYANRSYGFRPWF